MAVVLPGEARPGRRPSGSAGCWRWRRDGCSGRDRPAPARDRRTDAWRRRPIRAGERIEARGEGCRVGECGECAREAQLARRKRRLQPCQEQRPEPPGEDPHGQEEPRPAGDPSRLVGRQSAARDDAVQVRMVVQGLPPGVQHRHRADLGAEMARIGGDVAQCLGRGAEQDGVDRRACSGTRSPPPAPAG